MSPVARSTVQWSGETCPDTTDSPNPQLASTTSVFLSPVTGLRVNATPADRTSTSSSTPTARSWACGGRRAARRRRRYSSACAEYPLAQHFLMWLSTSAIPLIAEVGLVLAREAGPGPVLAHRA